MKKRISLRLLWIPTFLFALLLSGCQDKIFETERQIGNIAGKKLKHPNVLLVIADDVGLDAIPRYPEGIVKAKMPNLEKLMDNGVTFSNVWSFPMCSPTRASILTGKYAFRTGVISVFYPDVGTNHMSLQNLIAKETNNAYTTSVIGKWHVSLEALGPNANGVDYYSGMLKGQSDFYNWKHTSNGFSYQSHEYITTAFTDLAIDWINEQTKPWFCWLAYTAPHVPFHLPPDSLHSQGVLATDSTTIANNPLPYCLAMIESVDHEMGRLLDNIPPNVRANTIVIFLGDNGSNKRVIQSPYESYQGKASLYEGSVNVPMVISGPGVSRSDVMDESIINTTDLYATIAALCGAKVSALNDSDSYNFSHILTKPGKVLRTFNYAEIENFRWYGYTIRDDQYKYMHYDSNQEGFFDLKNDPYEKKNLMANPLSTSVENRFKKLKKKVLDLRKS